MQTKTIITRCSPVSISQKNVIAAGDVNRNRLREVLPQSASGHNGVNGGLRALDMLRYCAERVLRTASSMSPWRR